MNNKGLNQIPEAEPRFFYGYIVVIVAFIIQLVMFGPRTSFGVYFKPLITEFGWTRALISGAFSIGTIMQGLSSIVMGGLNDRLGPRVVMTLCGVFLGSGFLLMSLVNSVWQLYLIYLVMIGIGLGGVYAPPISTVARWFVKRRNVMTSIVLAGAGIGGLMVPPVINWLISAYGWRNSYIIMGALVLAIIILGAQFLKRDPAQMGQVPYGESKGGETRLDSGTEGLSFQEAVGTRQFWTAAAMIFCFGFFFFTVMVHIVPHATDLGISAAMAANILAVMSGGTIVGGIVLAGVADRIGIRRTYIFCFIIMSAALSFLLPATKVWMFYLVAIVLGLGAGGVATLASPLVAELFGMRSHGFLVGFISFASTTGAAAGPFLAGYIFDATGSYQIAFLVCVAVGVAGLVLAVISRPINKPGTLIV